MAYLLAGLVIIPIILAIVTISPFEPIEEEPKKQIPEEQEPQNDVKVLFYVLLGFWILLIIRVLYKLKQGTFKIRTKF